MWVQVPTYCKQLQGRYLFVSEGFSCVQAAEGGGVEEEE